MLITAGGNYPGNFSGGGGQICMTQAVFFLGRGRGWGLVVRTFFFSKTVKFWGVCPYPITPSHSWWICY